ncbi:MAG: diguanylate cyclase, partial [Aquabacterium sp.]
MSLLALSDRAERARTPSLLSSEVLDRARVLDTLVNNLDGMAFRCGHDAAWTMIFVSEGCTALTGYTPSELVASARTSWEALTYPDDRARVRAAIDEAVRCGRRFAQQYRITTRDGDIKWVLERGVPVADEQGSTVIEGFIENVTEQRAMIEALEQAELRYRSIFEHASEGIFQTTREGHYLAANPALARLYGYTTPQELITDLSDIGRRLYVLPGRREAFRRMMETHGSVRNFESEVYRNDGSRMWISENAHIVRGAQGEFICYEGTVQDISERKHYQEQLERQANHDLLTGLPNRVLLGDRLSQGLARAQRLGYYLAVVFIDLDHFKFVNDSLGHAAGDHLLQEVSRRLSACLRQSDTVARLGGDEFVLVLNDHYHVSTIISLLERVLHQIHQPISLCGRSLQVGASLGVALYPDDSEDAASLLRHADIAMYAAKDRGRHNFQFFTRDLNRMAEERLHLEAAMREALEGDDFDVHYQPKV